MRRPAAEDFGLLRVDGELWLAQGATPLLALSELPLAGLHNAANALAALALTRALDLSYAPLLAALRDFKGLPHRLEKVAEFDGVAYYDDSKGTNVGATVAALERLRRARRARRARGPDRRRRPLQSIKGGDNMYETLFSSLSPCGRGN